MNTAYEYSYTENDLKRIARRPERSNKYTFGRVLFICGSKGMAGACYLSALAAYRTGAGLCELFVPEENRIILQTLLPEAVITEYSKANTDILTERIDKADAVVIGCGLGTSDVAAELLNTLLNRSTVPTVIDADALNIISKQHVLKKKLRGSILTPHFAEMSRLSGKDISEISDDPKGVCRDFAASHGCVCVLKDHNTVVSDGERVYINTSGNSGMAKAGSGDLLAGIIGALLARRDAPLSTLDAATLGVYIHGLAGDVAAERLSEFSVLATDIAGAITEVMKKI